MFTTGLIVPRILTQAHFASVSHKGIQTESPFSMWRFMMPPQNSLTRFSSSRALFSNARFFAASDSFTPAVPAWSLFSDQLMHLSQDKKGKQPDRKDSGVTRPTQDPKRKNQDNTDGSGTHRTYRDHGGFDGNPGDDHGIF
jgi:hypothetical protein